MRDTTLSRAVLPSQSMLTQAGLVLVGTFLMGMSAQVEVPMVPVPMSMQTLMVSVIGLTYGSRLAAMTMLAYLAEGAMGLPVFSGGGAGVAHLFGPTFGFLIGFVGMAWMTGWMVERGFGRSLGGLFMAALIPAALLFVPGAGWLQAVTPLDMGGAIKAGILPFLPGMVVKAALAALVVSGGWKALERRRG